MLSARSRTRGVSTVEFAIVAMLVLLPLLTSVMELAQLAVARQALGYAATEVARGLEAEAPEVSTFSSGDTTAWLGDELRVRRIVGLALLPLFSQGEPLDGSTSALAGVFARAVAETLRPDLLRIDLQEIPATSPSSARFVSLHRVTLRYCRELYFAPISDLLPAVLRATTFDPFDQWCFANARMPISASAVLVRPRILAVSQARVVGSLD